MAREVPCYDHGDRVVPVIAAAWSANQVILTQFRDQPLVGGALAFAMGAAIGAALPHTDVEDELLGEVSDSTTNELGARALDLID